MSRLKTRVNDLENFHRKQRTMFVWRDDYKDPVQYMTKNGNITADELASMESDPAIKVVMFKWVNDLPDERYL